MAISMVRGKQRRKARKEVRKRKRNEKKVNQENVGYGLNEQNKNR
jgi:hypothetical protein